MASAKKFKFGKALSAGSREKTAGVVGYAGPKPPPGAYKLSVKRLFMDENRGGPVMRYLAEINDPRPEMKKFNGYPIWGGQNINDKSIGYLNQMLEAFGNGPKIKNAFYDSEGEVVVRKDDKGVDHIVKIGEARIKVDELSFVGICSDNSYVDKGGNRVTNLQIASYIPLSESEFDEDGGDDEEDFEDEDDVVDETGEDDESDFDDEDEEEDDDELFDDEDEDE